MQSMVHLTLQEENSLFEWMIFPLRPFFFPFPVSGQYKYILISVDLDVFFINNAYNTIIWFTLVHKKQIYM